MSEETTTSPITPEVTPAAIAEVTPATAETAKPSGAYPFSVLSVLGTAARVTKSNLIAFLVLACVLEIPSIAVQLLAEDALVAFVLQILTQSLMSAVVTYGVIMELQGSQPSAGKCITTGFSQLGRVLGVSLVSGIAVVAAMLALVVPGIIVALMLFVVVPVTVVERVGIDDAMKRSRELTSGRKGDLFLILVFGACVSVAVELVAVYELAPDAAFIWRAFGGAVTSMYFAVTSAVAYVVLRRLREGTQVPDLARAFARIRK